MEEGLNIQKHRGKAFGQRMAALVYRINYKLKGYKGPIIYSFAFVGLWDLRNSGLLAS